MIKREDIGYVSFGLFEVTAYLVCGVIFMLTSDLPPPFSHPIVEIYFLAPFLLSLCLFIGNMRNLFSSYRFERDQTSSADHA